jgi:hypothetical protein
VAPHAPGLFAAATPVAASSREQPIPVGQPGQFADYRITVDRVVPEADEEVAALVPLAEPEAGNQFTLATVTITYLGPGVGDAYLRLGFYAVAASGTEYGFVVNDCGELPQGLNDPRDLFTGGTVTHDLCWEVPVAEADDLVMQVSSSQFPDAAPAWFALDG